VTIWVRKHELPPHLGRRTRRVPDRCWAGEEAQPPSDLEEAGAPPASASTGYRAIRTLPPNSMKACCDEFAVVVPETWSTAPDRRARSSSTMSFRCGRDDLLPPAEARVEGGPTAHQSLGARIPSRPNADLASFRHRAGPDPPARNRALALARAWSIPHYRPQAAQHLLERFSIPS
jgi:hypothetical protein